MPLPDWNKIKKVADVLADHPLSVADIMSRAKVSRRTAYRWIDEMERRGYEIVRRRGPSGGFVFEILDAPPLDASR